jgi:hypothetical protein
VEYDLRYEINGNDWMEVSNEFKKFLEEDDQYELVWRKCRNEGGVTTVYIYIFKLLLYMR